MPPMPRTLIRAFDSYTSTDGGSTWTAPTSGIAAVASHLLRLRAGRRRAPLHQRAARRPTPQTVKDVVGSTSRNASWELDGYSNYTNGSLSNAASGQSSYTNAPFYGYTQGPGYYGKTFFIWPPDPRQPLTTTQQLDARSSSSSPISATRRTDFSSGDDRPAAQRHLQRHGHLGQPELALAQRRRHDARHLSDHEGLHPRGQPQAHDDGCRSTSRSCGSTPGTTWSTTWARPPATGGCGSSAPTTTPSCSTRRRVVEHARKLDLHDQLQRDPPLDHPVAEPVPDAVAGGPRQVLRIDPDRDHRDLAQLRQHRPAILGRVHRLCARLQADLLGRLHRTSAPWPATAAISPGEPTPSPLAPSATQYMSYTDNPIAPAAALLVQPDRHGRLSAELQHG